MEMIFVPYIDLPKLTSHACVLDLCQHAGKHLYDIVIDLFHSILVPLIFFHRKHKILFLPLKNYTTDSSQLHFMTCVFQSWKMYISLLDKYKSVYSYRKTQLAFLTKAKFAILGVLF